MFDLVHLDIDLVDSVYMYYLIELLMYYTSLMNIVYKILLSKLL